MNIPAATYRLQFSPNFTFENARHIIEYLARLGISHIYASPIFKPRSGSTHGYDVVDSREINPALGGETIFKALVNDCEKAGIGWVQDIVPNHMALSAENPFLVDVVENGPLSRYYSFFDIDWNHPYDTLNGRIMIPVLGKSFGRCLEDGELQLKFDQDGLYVAYYNHRFPLRMESYAIVLGGCVPELRDKLGDKDHDLLKFLGVLYTVKNLPDETNLKERYVQIGFVKTMLWEIYQTNTIIRDECDRILYECNGNNNSNDPWGMLEKVLTEQHFRLTFWKTATEELNYRRFFTVNDLIAVRVEDDTVFSITHRKLLDLVVSGYIKGLRIDHIDGLYHPVDYCARLRSRTPDTFIVVEKILGRKEELCKTWPVQGTTGYDFLNMVNELFCSRSGEKTIDRTYMAIAEDDRSYAELITDKKRLIIGRHMAGDIDNLALQLKALAGRDRRGIDITMYGLRRALVELLTFFPVYRTYVNESEFSDIDKAVLRQAINAARAAQEEYVSELDYIEMILGLSESTAASSALIDRRQFVMRLQQFTSPLLAKGIEDTALYTYNRLVSLNEVGGHPEIFGIKVDDFHAFCLRRAQRWSHTMNATATHDTKRGEGTRARINVLSELGKTWSQKIRAWHAMNRSALTKKSNGEVMPVMNDAYLYYQTLVGSFPFAPFALDKYRKRIEEYMLKAVREAKVHSSWIRPNERYENALRNFVHTTLSSDSDNRFLQEFEPFQRLVAWYGMLNSLSQTVLKITAPGVPDFYQGTELWDFSLVDPDNRRPVDFTLRKELLDTIIAQEKHDDFIASIQATPQDGRIKLFLVWRLCQLRKRMEQLFQNGDYTPLEVKGTRNNSIVAFMRTFNNKAVVVVVPRMLTQVIQDEQMPIGKSIWNDTAVLVPEEFIGCVWKSAIVNSSVVSEGIALFVGDVLDRFPVAVAVAE